MTAERDRLAALLHAEIRHPAVEVIPDEWVSAPRTPEELADRLIAAGVHLDIDEERLARALERADHQTMGFSATYAEVAAAIAAAYREDAAT